MSYQPVGGPAAILDLGDSTARPSARRSRDARLSSFNGEAGRSNLSSAAHSWRAVASVKPEPTWPTWTSLPPSYTASTSEPTDLRSVVEGTKPGDDEAVALAHFTLSQSRAPRAVGRRRLLGDDALEAKPAGVPEHRSPSAAI